MPLRERAEPASARWSQLATDDPLCTVYQQAANELTLPALAQWVREQPPQRLLTQPRSVLSCLVAIFLTERTKHLWAVTDVRFYLFTRGEGWSWALPTWALTCQRVELAWDRPLTTREGLDLVRFLDAHPGAAEWQIAAWLKGRKVG
ncbi:MAG: hypothetical protein H0X24_14530 [Ktedonobacterales bacterium]|nr:hypothetical protein [Ktedonobacterales bacterium]